MQLSLSKSFAVVVVLATSTVRIFADEKVESVSREIILLEEIVEIREEVFDQQKQLENEARASDSSGAKLALLRARIDLAREKGEFSIAVTHLESIAEIHQRVVKSHELEMELGKGNSM